MISLLLRKRARAIKKNNFIKKGDKKMEDVENIEEKGSSWISGLLKLIVSILIIAGAIWGAKFLIKTGPKSKKTEAKAMVVKVKTTSLKSENKTIIVNAMGTVIPAREVVLYPRVSGEVIKVNKAFQKGNILSKDELILKIEDKDLELAIEQKELDIENLKNDLKIEQGNANIAAREWELANIQNANTAEKDLALRKPQIAKIETAIKRLKSGLKKIKLEKKRTEVKAPFNSIVMEKMTELGSQLDMRNKIVNLIGTDEFYIEVALSQNDLKFLNLDTAKVRVILSENDIVIAKIVRLLSSVEKQGRMAKLLLSVKDPLCLNLRKSQTPLLLNKFVKIEISGQKLNDIIALDRNILRDNSTLWFFEEGKLKIEKAKVLWKDYSTVYIKNEFAKSAKIIISDIPGAIEGMHLIE